MFKSLKGKTMSKDQDKALKITHITKMNKEGRKGVNKPRKGSTKIRHHPSTLKGSSSKN